MPEQEKSNSNEEIKRHTAEKLRRIKGTTDDAIAGLESARSSFNETDVESGIKYLEAIAELDGAIITENNFQYSKFLPREERTAYIRRWREVKKMPASLAEEDFDLVRKMAPAWEKYSRKVLDELYEYFDHATIDIKNKQIDNEIDGLMYKLDKHHHNLEHTQYYDATRPGKETKLDIPEVRDMKLLQWDIEKAERHFTKLLTERRVRRDLAEESAKDQQLKDIESKIERSTDK